MIDNMVCHTNKYVTSKKTNRWTNVTFRKFQV
jgi:hypothetical protein